MAKYLAQSMDFLIELDRWGTFQHMVFKSFSCLCSSYKAGLSYFC